jgi:predicted membrane metal-binding protein
MIMITFIFAAAGWWEIIFEKLGHLSIHINLGGYLLIATVLLGLWFANFVFFDRQTYMVFTPGQVRIRTEIGGEETVYDTNGMAVMKQRTDLFRHWILGFGSGDLIIKPVGLSNPIEFNNVLRVGTLVAKVETMIKEKVVVRTPREPHPPGT